MNYFGVLTIYLGFLGCVCAGAFAAEDDDTVNTSENEGEGPSARIIGGSIADPGEYPWQVYLTYKNSFLCGGVILDSETVLTASHCVEDDKRQRRGKFKVYVGVSDRNNDLGSAQTSLVTTIEMHPKYKATTVNNDVAVLHLATPLTFNSLVAAVGGLATGSQEKTLAKSGNCSVTGYGARTDYPGYKMSRYLKELSMSLVSYTACRRFYVKNFGYQGITKKMICSLDTHGTDCVGDSGGPMGCYDHNGDYILLGLVSFGPENTCMTPPSVFARISRLRSWILAEAAN